jgi:class 3 adenylate cyclase
VQSAPDVVGADVLTAVVFVRRDLPGSVGAPELDVGGLQASGGAVIKALPTGVMLVFPTASGALAWSAARLAADAGGLAIGVSVGDVVVAEDDRFGITVVEAARLCNAAEPGTGLATVQACEVAGLDAATVRPTRRRRRRRPTSARSSSPTSSARPVSPRR